MHIVLVQVHVKPGTVTAFIEATVENAALSREEPGVARFDVIQQAADPARFLLVEVYRNEEAAAAHKETAHYQKWRGTVADMMAEPRKGVPFVNISPEDKGW